MICKPMHLVLLVDSLQVVGGGELYQALVLAALEYQQIFSRNNRPG